MYATIILPLETLIVECCDFGRIKNTKRQYFKTRPKNIRQVVSNSPRRETPYATKVDALDES